MNRGALPDHTLWIIPESASLLLLLQHGDDPRLQLRVGLGSLRDRVELVDGHALVFHGADHFVGGLTAHFLDLFGRSRRSRLALPLLADRLDLGRRRDERLQLRVADRSPGRSGRLGSRWLRSEEHTSELQSLMRSSYDVFCLTKKK